MASGPITSWEIDGETVADFIFLSSKITADGDWSHEIKRHLLLGRKVMTKLLLLLLSLFSCVRFCATPQMAAHQAPPPLGFSRQEYWSGLPFPSPMHESEKWKWSRSVVSNSSRPHGLQPTRLLCPWDFPGKNTGVGCHWTRQHIKKQRRYFANKGLSSQGYGFSSSHVWMWELYYKENWAPKNWCFWTVELWCWRRLLRVPWTAGDPTSPS